MVFKSDRPTYAIILLVFSSLWMCATFLPLLYFVTDLYAFGLQFRFVMFPNQYFRGIVDALEERGTAPPEAVAVVQETIATVGPLTRAVPVADYSGVTATVRISESQTSRKKQASYIAWFQRHPKPLLIVITVYEGDGGRRAYEINEGEAMFMVRGYALPILLFGVSLFLVRGRKLSASAL